jgi:hypothetical protein
MQTALLAFAVIIRGSIGYFLMAIALLSVVVLWRGRSRRALQVKVFSAWASLAATTVVVLAIIVTSVPSEYVSSGRFFGNFWHRVIISMSVNSAWRHARLREMFPCTNAYPEDMHLRFDPVGFCVWYAAQPDYRPTPEQLISDQATNFYDAAYERVMRDAFFRIVKSYPGEVLNTFIREKSKLIRSTLLEAIAATDPRDSAAAPPGHSSLLVRVMPIVVLQFIVFAACVVSAGAGSAREMVRLTGVFASLFVLSLIPLYAVYSNLYVSLDTVIYVYALFVIGVTLSIQVLAAASRKLFNSPAHLI